MIYINDHIYDFDLAAALEELSEQRRALALRFRHELGQRTCAAAYLLLCEGLRKEYGVMEKPQFVYGVHGKPSIAGRPDIHFNLSHCREAVVCALSDRPIGVDVESPREYKERLVSYTMNEEEQTEIRTSENPVLAFIRLWTRKEAYVKMTGQGIEDLKHVLEHSDAKFTTVESSDGRYVYTVCEPLNDTLGTIS